MLTTLFAPGVIVLGVLGWLQVEQGADLLDINMDDGLIEGVGAMTRFVNLLVADPETSRVPFMIDSSKVTPLLPPLKFSTAMSSRFSAYFTLCSLHPRVYSPPASQ